MANRGLQLNDMATITITEYHANAGSIWSRVVQLWETYIVDLTLAWASSVGAVLSRLAVTITITGAVDTTVYRLVDVNRASSQRYPIDFIFTLPGMMKTPKVLEFTYGARVTKTLWASQTATVRANMVLGFTNGSNLNNTSGNFTQLNPSSETSWLIWTYRDNTIVAQDILTMTTIAQTATEYAANGENPAVGVTRQSISIVGGSGGAVDTAPIVAALNDIALIDVEYTANNGGAVWSMRGKVRSP